MADGSFLASFGLIVQRLLVAEGIDWPRFATELGLPAKQSAPIAGRRLPSALLDRVFAAALQQIPDPAFGLRASEHWHPSHLGALGYAWLSSPNLQSALDRLVRYAALLGDRSSLSLSRDNVGVTLRFVSNRPASAVSNVMADVMLTLLLSLCRHNYGPTLPVLAVKLRRPAPAEREPWLRTFASTVHFGSPEDSITLPRATVDANLATANPDLLASLDAILARQLSEHGTQDWTTRCKVAVLNALAAGEPDETVIASQLALSPRSLQRKLSAEGTGFSALVRHTRHTLACDYLRNEERSLTEIAFLLGFSEPSAFSRAFKRWQGQSPSAFRQAHAPVAHR